MAVFFICLFLCCVGSWLPLEIQSNLYSFSLLIQSTLIFFLPFIVMTLLFQTALRLARNATKIIFLIIASVCLSNFISTCLSYGLGTFVFRYLNFSLAVPQHVKGLMPSWSFSLPSLLPNDKAMVVGLSLGILGSFFYEQQAQKFSSFASHYVNLFLKKFQYVLPLFVSGFVIKMLHDGIMLNIIKDYSVIFLGVALGQFAWIFFLYGIASHLHFASSWQKIKNMVPAALTGLSTMSSAAAMPLTLVGTEKNADHKDLAKSIIPATVNIHLVGDCFAIPIFAFAVLKSYGMAEPSFLGYMAFAFYFVLAKFSVAAIPGGGILVMLPILKKYLGFSGDMLSFITALYILFDPVITSANVFGNGAFSVLLSNYFKKWVR